MTHDHAHMHDRASDKIRRIDPTRCTDLRSRLNTYFRRALNEWRSQIRQLIVSDDAIGISKHISVTWDPADRLDRFADFARAGAVRVFIDRSKARSIIVLAYNRGRLKAYSELKQERPTGKTSVIFTSQATHELTGIIEATIQQMVRAVTHGIHTKQSSFAIYRDLLSSLKKVAKVRLNLLTQNIITASYNAGKLDAYSELGITRVGVEAEAAPRVKARDGFADADLVQVMTAGDDLVCPICEDLEGEVFDLDDAPGVLPAHINCRCVWILAGETIDAL